MSRVHEKGLEPLIEWNGDKRYRRPKHVMEDCRFLVIDSSTHGSRSQDAHIIEIYGQESCNKDSWKHLTFDACVSLSLGAIGMCL
jgi:hypothetical protein